MTTPPTVPHIRTGQIGYGPDPTDPTGKGMVVTVACGLTLPVRGTTADRADSGCPDCVTAYAQIVHDEARTSWRHYGQIVHCTCGHEARGRSLVIAATAHRAHIEEMNAA